MHSLKKSICIVTSNLLFEKFKKYSEEVFKKYKTAL